MNAVISLIRKLYVGTAVSKTLCLAVACSVLLLAFFGFFSQTKANNPDTTFGAESFMLDNGMQVIVIPNHRVPVVTHMVWYRVGAADELPGLSGMAHYFEHLMFKGTKKLEPGEFSRTVKMLGGRDNAFTGQDYTAYFQSIAIEHLETVMRMEADRMLNLAPPPEHFSSEKKVVLEERRQRTENDPRGLFAEQLRSLLFVNHPYNIPTIGWMDEIEKYEWEDVKGFYERWYAPNNAIVIISGDITAEDFKPLAQKIYGKIKAKKLPKRSRPKIPPAIGATYVTAYHENIKEPLLYKLLLAPNAADSKEDALALEVLQNVMSAGATTRLYKSLAVEQKKAISVSLQYRSAALDYGSISISATPNPGVDLKTIEDLIEAEIQKIIQDGISDQELQDSIQRLQDNAVFAKDSLSGPAMIMGYNVLTGSSVEDVESWPRDIATVSKEAVQDVAKKYLNSQKPWIRPAVTGYLYPETDNKDNEKK